MKKNRKKRENKTTEKEGNTVGTIDPNANTKKTDEKDERFELFEEEEDGPPVNMYGQRTKYYDKYVSSSDEEFPDEFKKYDINVQFPSMDTTKDSTSRLALIDLSWEDITAHDIFGYISRSLASDDYKDSGLISVTVYLSNYGKENLESIQKEVFLTDEKEEIRMYGWRNKKKKLAKCYFAVCEFQSIEDADKCYELLNDTEIMDTGNRFDLSFVPDDMDFIEYHVRDTASSLNEKWVPETKEALHMSRTNVAEDWEDVDKEREKIFEKIWQLKSDEEDTELIRQVLASDDDDVLTREDLKGTLDALSRRDEYGSYSDDDYFDSGDEEQKIEEPKKVSKISFISKADAATDKVDLKNASAKKYNSKNHTKDDEKANKAIDNKTIVSSILEDERFTDKLDKSGYGIELNGMKKASDALNILRNELAKSRKLK